MGDVLTLVERAQETFDAKQAESWPSKLRKNAFTLEDFLEQMQQLKKMGPIGGLLEHDPGHGRHGQGGAGGRRPRRAQAGRGDHPLDDARRAPRARDPQRLAAAAHRARGSGTTLPDVNRLLKQFAEMQKMMRQLGGSGGRRAGAPAARSALKIVTPAHLRWLTKSSQGRDLPGSGTMSM